MWNLRHRASASWRGLRRRWTCLAPLLFLFVLTFNSGAEAQSCTTTTAPIAFGSTDVLPGTPIDGVGSISVVCTGFAANQKLLVCFGLDNGTYPLSGTSRQMGSGANRLAFDAFKDAARSVVWTNTGSGLIGVTVTATSLSVVAPVYARIFGSQQAAPPGAYTTTLSQPVSAKFYTTGTPPVCGALPVFGADQVPVSATVISACNVTTTPLNFGVTSLFLANIDQTSSISVACTTTTTYQVRIDGGVAAVTSPALRKMSLGANKISYGLYRDLARSLPWGSTDGVDTQPGTGTSAAIGHTVYGRIPPQASQPPGVYVDTVVVTVSFM